MKNFKFRLEAILKLKKLSEDKLKSDIGRIQVQIENNKKKIINDDKDIDIAHASQAEGLAQGFKGEDLAFYPYFEKGKKASIKYLQDENIRLEKEKELLLEQLAQARATVKVYDKMKERDYESFRKEILKKQNDVLEEEVLVWYHQRNKHV